MVVLRHRTIKGYYYWLAVAALLAVALFALVHPSTAPPPAATSSLAVEASAAVRGALDNDLDNDGQVDGIPAASLVASTTTERQVRGELDNDLDNDGLPDGMSDPIVGLVFVSLLILIVGGSLVLLALYKLPLVGCDYHLPLERPG